MTFTFTYTYAYPDPVYVYPSYGYPYSYYYGPSFGIGIGFGNYYGDPFWGDPFYRGPFHGGPYWPEDVETTQRYEASAEVVMGHGPKPAGDKRAFDAHEVMANLGPHIVRPK